MILFTKAVRANCNRSAHSEKTTNIGGKKNV